MKIVPFPLPLNIGVDIVHIPRIHRLITRSPIVKGSTPTNGSRLTTTTFFDRFIRRILTAEEQKYFHSKFPLLQYQTTLQTTSPYTHTSKAGTGPLHHPSDSAADTEQMARWLAGRFA